MATAPVYRRRYGDNDSSLLLLTCEGRTKRKKKYPNTLTRLGEAIRT